MKFRFENRLRQQRQYLEGLRLHNDTGLDSFEAQQDAYMLSREINRCRQQLKIQQKTKEEFQKRNEELKKLKEVTKVQLLNLKMEVESRNR